MRACARPAKAVQLWTFAGGGGGQKKPPHSSRHRATNTCPNQGAPAPDGSACLQLRLASASLLHQDHCGSVCRSALGRAQLDQHLVLPPCRQVDHHALGRAQRDHSDQHLLLKALNETSLSTSPSRTASRWRDSWITVSICVRQRVDRVLYLGFTAATGPAARRRVERYIFFPMVFQFSPTKISFSPDPPLFSPFQ